MIPKIIHQTAPADKSKWHPIWEICQNSWKENFPSPEYSYKFWNDDDLYNLIKTDFPDYLQLYNDFGRDVILKVDFARYAILYKYGGIYSDMDFLCKKNFYNQLANNLIIVESSASSEIVQNSLMASPPNDIRWLQVLDNCKNYYYTFIKENPNTKISGKYVIDITGPRLLSRALDMRTIQILPKLLYNPYKSGFYNENIFTTNFLDDKIGTVLKNFYIPLLLIYISIFIFYSFINSKNYKFVNVIEKTIQSWIILNGIVPFSAKLILLFNRNSQAYLYSSNSLEYMKSDIIDNIPYTKHLICDKTGTITKNKLSLKYFTFDINNKRVFTNIDEIKLLPEVVKFLILSINVRSNIYSTHEDRILAEKIYSLGYIFSQNDKTITIYNNSKTAKKTIFNILDNKNLLFNSSRKLSSVIFSDRENSYIVSKGPIKKIKSLITNDQLKLIDTDTSLLNIEAPHLRTISFAYKQITYDKNLKAESYELSGNYKYITTLGIEDELQEDILDTITKIKNTHKVSICTGDRKETAIEIARITGIYKNSLIEIDDIINNVPYNFAFSGDDISSVMSSLDKLENFKNRLFNSNGFIGYSLIPQHKKFIANLFESSNIKVCSIGDGNNDIPMLKTSTIAISMDNNINNNVVSSSDIRVTSFSKVKNIFRDSEIFLRSNKLTTYLIFYKTILVNTVLLLWIFNNNLNLTQILFNFIEIQGFHLVWGFLPMIFSNLYIPETCISFSYIKYIAPSAGFINAILINYLTQNKLEIFIATVISININFILFYKYHKINILSISFGLLVFFVYICSF